LNFTPSASSIARCKPGCSLSVEIPPLEFTTRCHGNSSEAARIAQPTPTGVSRLSIICETIP
jgi:hypothetical protein